VISDPSDSEQPVSAQPEPTEAPAQESDSLDAVLTPELVEELTAPIATVELVSETGKTRIFETPFVSDNSVTKPVPQLQDEILQQPSNLTQAAQTVVVPAENNQTPWGSFSLFAGLLGIGTFALIAGLVLARRGVPGAIAS
jgi:hypothetical protein